MTPVELIIAVALMIIFLAYQMDKLQQRIERLEAKSK